MSTRSRAADWLAKAYPSEVANLMKSSKYFKEPELWFLTCPSAYLASPLPGHLIVVLEHENIPDTYHVLKVPFAYFREHKAKFDLRKKLDKFDLHLSARSSSWLRDLRGDGVEFDQFSL
jgi:hypothetical protein